MSIDILYLVIKDWYKKTTTQPFALLEDWEEANRLVGGGSIDTKKITGSYLASNVRDYARIHQGKIMTPRSFSNERKRLPVERLISEYYEHSLENRLQLRPHLLGWLKEKMEERLDSCGYAMRYGKEYNQENIVATKYLLKMIDRSFTITEQNLVAIRDAWKVLLLDDFHLEWLKEYLLYETKSESERLARFDTTAMPISKGVDESKCGLAIMKHLLEIIDGSLVN